MRETVFLYGPKPSGMFATSLGRPLRHWELDGNRARLIFEDSIEIEIEDPCNDEALLETLKGFLGPSIKNAGEWKMYRAPFAANQYYPRIFRPVYTGPTKMHMRVESTHVKPPYDRRIATDTAFQLSVMAKSLQRICEVVSPTDDNLDAYGHEIRNLLIVACTEFEAQCKGVLIANSYGKAKTSTQDYVKLLRAMKLADYSAKISPYAGISDRTPFVGWSSERPTKSLPWYDAYNATKHDREKAFSRATLRHAFDAIAACAIITYAQYGLLPTGEVSTADFLLIRNKPKWMMFRCYSKVGYSSDEWEPLSFPFA